MEVAKVGAVSTTNFVPVPVWEAIEVALPTEVMTPVKLAFVVTVPAFPPMERFVTGVVEVTENGAVPVAKVEVS
jgi:hypothetical protein